MHSPRESPERRPLLRLGAVTILPDSRMGILVQLNSVYGRQTEKRTNSS